MSEYIQEEKKSWMNVWIYLLWKNPRIFWWMNIFVNKYSNIFEYPNIRNTLDPTGNVGKVGKVRKVEKVGKVGKVAQEEK